MESLYRGHVVGIKFRQKDFDACVDFLVNDCEGDQPEVRVMLEPENKYDPKAVKVMLGSGEAFWHIGYVPKQCTEKIHGSGMEGIKARFSQFNEFENKVVGVDIEVFKQN